MPDKLCIDVCFCFEFLDRSNAGFADRGRENAVAAQGIDHPVNFILLPTIKANLEQITITLDNFQLGC